MHQVNLIAPATALEANSSLTGRDAPVEAVERWPRYYRRFQWNHGHRVVEILPPQLQLSGTVKEEGGNAIKAEPVAIKDFPITSRKLGVEERADGVVLFARPAFKAEIRQLMGRMKADNPTWGAPRIHGELLRLWFGISEPTVSRYLRRLRAERAIQADHFGPKCSILLRLMSLIAASYGPYVNIWVNQC